MKDIVSFQTGFDLGIQDTIVPKAGNLLETQLGSLDFAPAFGVDLHYFLTSNFKFQPETFKSYLIGQMIQNQINVNEVSEVIDSLDRTFDWDVGDLGVSRPGVLV